MGRELRFDCYGAIAKSTGLFWKSGYSGTSLRALLKAMGIGEGSFYNTFKSKKQLYARCLEHYNDTVGRERGNALMSGLTVKEGVRALFSKVLDCLDNPKNPRVCMMTGALTGDVLAEPELKRYVHLEMRKFKTGLIERMRRDKNAGLLPSDFEPELVAPIIVTYLQGLFRLALVAYDRQEFERQVDVLLKGLRL